MNKGFCAVSILTRRHFIVILTILLLVLPVVAQVDVPTQHNNTMRTGANLDETILTPSNVNVNQFGMLFKRTVDDQVYGQPLVISNVSIGGGTHNVVYVTTVHNSVYAFDADDASATTAYWHRNFGTAVPAAGHFGCTDMTGNMSIVGTPVVDTNTNTLYVVSLTPSGTSFAWRLHALDLSTGAEKFGGPVQVSASGFNALNQNQRPALLLANGNVYIGYSSHCDQNTYHGFLIGYNASTLQQIGVFNSSPNTSGKGNSIWHSGTGPAVDASGNIYAITGNGTWDGVTRFSETFVKLSPSLHMIDWFTPHDHATMDSADADVNSGGPLLIPGTSLLVGGGKGAKLYVVDTNNFGHLGNSTDSNIVQSFQTGTFNKQHLHSLAFWNNKLYTWPQADRFKVYQFNGSKFNTTPIMIQPTANTGHPGGMISISANGNTNGIVWAAIMASGDAWHSSRPGILHAIDANDINHELWNSLQNSARDNCNNYSKMAPPTIANGKVYLPSFGTANAGSGQFCVYGLLNNGNPDFALSRTPTSRTVTAGNGTSYTVTVSALNGFTGTVSLSLSGLPSGATGTFNPTSVIGSGTSTLSVSTASSTPPGTYTLTIHGASGTLSHTVNVTLIVNPVGGTCVTAGTTWQNSSFTSQTGTFTATFDGTPATSPINSVMALSHGAQTAYTGFAALARFNPSGNIDARSGSAYTAASTIPYSGGKTYHFRLVINTPAHTYSIFVTPPGGSELTVGTNFNFRTEQATASVLDNFGVVASTGSNTVCNFAVQ